MAALKLKALHLPSLRWLAVLVAFWAAATQCRAQSLTLAAGSGPKGGTISAPLQLSTGTTGIHPAALQWTLLYTTSDFTAVTVTAIGNAAAAAGKSVTCRAVTGALTCLAAGVTSNSIQDGVIAVLTFSVSGSTTSSSSIAVLTSVLGASTEGNATPLSTFPTTLTIQQTVVQNIAGLTCSPGTLTTPATAACTVTLTAPAPPAGLTVTLYSNASTVTVPSSVAVSPGSSSASFNATAAAVPVNSSATVTASANGTSGSFTLSLTALPVANGLSCSPATVTGGTASLCTVSLSAPARPGGTAVTLSGATPNVSFPGAVTVPEGVLSAGFTVSTTPVSSTQNVTVSAAAGGAGVSAGLTILSFTTVGGLSCTPGQLTPPGLVTCVIGLTGPAPAGGLTASVSSSNSNAPVPATVPIAAGATSAVFTSSTFFVTSDTTAIFTVVINGVARMATVSLFAPATLAPLSCSPSSFSGPGTTTCTINLVHPADSKGLVATVISTDPDITVPSYVTIAPGASSATFVASANKGPTTAKSSTIFAVAAGVSQNVQITVLPPPGQAGISCSPTAIATPGSATCTVTIPTSAPQSGTTITLLVDNSNVTIPSQVTIPYGGKSATFPVAAALVSADQTAIITMPSAALQSLALLAPPAVSALNCAVPVLSGGGSTRCTVTTQTPVRGNGLDVPLTSSNSKALSMPATVHVPVGFTTGTFTVNVLSGAPPGPVVITATGGGAGLSFVLIVRPHGLVTQLSCAPQTITAGGATTCEATISPAAPQGGTALYVTSGSTQLFVQPTVQVPAGAVSAQFTVYAPLIDHDETTPVIAALDGTAQAQLSLAALRPESMTCSPKTVESGTPLTCVVALNSPGTNGAPVTLGSNSPLVMPPVSVVTQLGLTSLSFQAGTNYVHSNQTAAVSASFKGVTVVDTVTLTPARPVINAPAHVTVLAGQIVVFTVTAPDPVGLAVVLSASGIPDGASFNPATGAFIWTPGDSQLGSHVVQFKATNLALASSTANTVIDVTSTTPTITALVNAASHVAGPTCSPGGVATLTGGGFTQQTDQPSSSSPPVAQLGGVSVKVNGESLPIFYASTTQVNFQCPNLPAGQTFSLTAEGGLGMSKPFATTMQFAAPGIFTADGSGVGQGAIVVAGSNRLASAETAGSPAAPPKPGDSVSIYATGLGPTQCAVPLGQAAPADTLCALTGAIDVLIGGGKAYVSYAGLAPGFAGLYQVNAQIPADALPGIAVPVQIVVHGPNDAQLPSNVVAIAVAQPPTP